MSNPFSSPPMTQDGLLYIQGFLATLSDPILSSNPHFFSNIFQKDDLLKKLGQDSTSSERSYFPYWNPFSQAMSDWLSLPTKTEWQDLGSISSNGSANGKSVKSWFSTKQVLVQSEKWLKTFSLSSMSSVADSTDSENISESSETILNCNQYRMVLSPEQSTLLKKWVKLSRWAYNQSIAYLNKHQGFERVTKGSGKQAFRSFWKQSERPEWLTKELPAHILDNTLMEAYSAWVKTKKVKGKRYAKFRSVRNPSQTLQFSVGDLNQGRLLPQYWGKESTEAFECIDNGVRFCPISDKAVEVTLRLGRFSLSIPVETEVLPHSRKPFIALDPGVRNFLTGFDGNSFLEFGSGDIGRITRLCFNLDDLMSRRDLAKGFKTLHLRHRLSKAASRLRMRIKNLVNEMHRKTASYLAKNYGAVALPTYETSQMVLKVARKLRKKSVRAMLSWAMYRFSQVLGNQCAKYGSVLIRHTEEYTSKTCTKCGHIHQTLGGSKIFNCKNCGNVLGRDKNGALGNFLKALWDSTLITFDGNHALIALP
jgi:putative transposase